MRSRSRSSAARRRILSIWMISKFGSPIAPVCYLIAAAVVSTVVIWTLKETAFDELA